MSDPYGTLKDMKVFISSVITGYEDYRDAAAHAATVLGNEVIRAEDFPASPQTPQQACLQGIRAADIVVLLLGERYGAMQTSGRSATHEEFDEASRSTPMLVFHHDGVTRDPDMQAFVNEVQGWEDGSFTGQYRTPSKLADAVTRALADHAVNEQRHQANDPELIERAATGATINTHHHSSPILTVSISCGPTQALLRPADIDDEALRSELLQSAMFGPARVIDASKGARTDLDGNRLRLHNDNTAVTVSPTGDIIVSGHTPTSGGLGMNSLIEEDIRELVQTYLSFADGALQRIDPTANIRSVAIAVSITTGAAGWRTRAEAAANPNSMTFSVHNGEPPGPILLDPPVRPRPHLSHRCATLAEDFTVLLRRHFLP